MRTKLIPIIILFMSCNSQDEKKTTARFSREDSLIKLIDSLKSRTEGSEKTNNLPQNQASKKKFVFVLINYIKGYEYYLEFKGIIKKIEEEKGNYQEGEWSNHLDTLTTMSSIREFDYYDADTEYQLLDEVEKSLPLNSRKNEKNIDILKVNYRTVKTFNTYAEASKAQENYRRQNENQRVQSLKDDGFKFNK